MSVDRSLYYSGENTDAMKKHTATLLDANDEVGREMNPEKTKYMVDVTLSERRKSVS
jgi:hypothetical protein